MILQPWALRNTTRGNCRDSLNPAFCAAVCDFAKPEAMDYLLWLSRKATASAYSYEPERFATAELLHDRYVVILPKDLLSGTLLVRCTPFKDYLMIRSSLLSYALLSINALCPWWWCYRHTQTSIQYVVTVTLWQSCMLQINCFAEILEVLC